MISKIITILGILSIATMALVLSINLKDKDIAIIVFIFAIMAIVKCVDDLFENGRQ